MFRIRGADGKEYGPVGAEQLRQWIAERRANGQTMVQAEGSEEWKPLSEFPDFSEALTAAALPPASAPEPAPASPITHTPYPAAPQKKAHPLAVTGMILGILSLMCCGILGVVFSMAALIVSGLALTQINRNPDLHAGKGLAIAGMVMGGIGLVSGIAVTVFWLSGGLESLMEEMNR